jgi:hypothetical protein
VTLPVFANGIVAAASEVAFVGVLVETLREPRLPFEGGATVLAKKLVVFVLILGETVKAAEVHGKRSFEVRQAGVVACVPG